MREYFHQAEAVVGIDINPATKQFEEPGRGIFVEIGDQRDLSFLERVHAVHGPFDVVLDDGSHRIDDVVASFQRLFPLLRDGGVYIVEDTICFRDDLDYFHKLTRHVNNWRKDAAGGSDTCVDPFKFTLSVTDPVHSSIREITFTNSAILIFKEVKPHWVVRRR
jgi:hypothetical protein